MRIALAQMFEGALFGGAMMLILFGHQIFFL